MGKGNRKGFGARRLLFAFAAFSQILNWILMSLIADDFLAARTGLIALAMIAIAVMVLCDKRSNHVSWAYVLLVSAFYFLSAAFVSVRLTVYWCLWVIIPEACVFIVLAIILYRLYGKKK